MSPAAIVSWSLDGNTPLTVCQKGLVKENRCPMAAQTNFFAGLDSRPIPAVEHDIAGMYEIIFDCVTTGKKNPVLTLNDEYPRPRGMTKHENTDEKT